MKYKKTENRPIRDFVRYCRRASVAASDDFARDERGSVMVTVIVLALPLATMLFVSFNTGAAIVTRMRAQNVADAASYTTSLWQARFLNYCAYTRRHIVANYADIALMTAYENIGLYLVDQVYDAAGLIAGGGDVEEFLPLSVKTQMFLINPLMELAVGEDGLKPVQTMRVGMDLLNGFLSMSQLFMGFQVGFFGTATIMEDAVRDALPDPPPAGLQRTEFELIHMLNSGTLNPVEATVFGSHSAFWIPTDTIGGIRSGITSGAASFGVNLNRVLPADIVEREPIMDEDASGNARPERFPEIYAYFDSYANANAGNIISLLGRKDSSITGFFTDIGNIQLPVYMAIPFFPFPVPETTKCWGPPGFIMSLFLDSNPMVYNEDGSEVSGWTEPIVPLSWYWQGMWCWAWYPPLFPVPGPFGIPLPIVRPKVTTTYKLLNPIADTLVFEFKDDVRNEDLEPSAWAVVEAKPDTTPLIIRAANDSPDFRKQVRTGLPLYWETVEEERAIASSVYSVPLRSLAESERVIARSKAENVLWEGRRQSDSAGSRDYALVTDDLAPEGGEPFFDHYAIRAFSRSKVYFKSWDEDLAGAKKYAKPNLNYPFWGAKLAGILDNERTSTKAQFFLVRDGEFLDTIGTVAANLFDSGLLNSWKDVEY